MPLWSVYADPCDTVLHRERKKDNNCCRNRKNYENHEQCRQSGESAFQVNQPDTSSPLRVVMYHVRTFAVRREVLPD